MTKDKIKKLKAKDLKFEKTIPPITPWSFFFFISNQHRVWMWGAILVVITASAISTGISYFFKLIVDAVEAGDVDMALRYGLLFPLAILSVQILYRLSGWFGMHWTIRSTKTAFDTLSDYILKHSHNYYSNRFAGSITNKFRNVTGSFESIIPDFLWGQIDPVVTFIVTFVLIAQVDLKTASMFVVLLILLIIVNQKMASKKKIFAKNNAEAGTALQGSLVDTLSNVSVVRQYTMQNAESSILKDLSHKKQQASFSNWGYTEIMLLVNSLVMFICASFMFWFLVDAWREARIGTGDFILVLALVSNITGTLLFVGRAFNALARTVGELEEALGDVLVPYDITDLPNAKKLLVTNGQIDFKDVKFSFEEAVVFSDFNLEIPAKQRLGIVGTSGAGKSTFVSLLLRQFDIESGEILIDGQKIAGVTQDSLRQSIAVVPQDPSLFHRTIKENIAYSCPSATMVEIEEAAKKAEANEFIMSLKNGYETIVGERGVKLSGGQRQRIAIARAILKNAPILILDEATSALDSESEVAIQKALQSLMKDKTVIAIAHRLSTLREMDRIIVLEQGQVTEDGTHSELKSSGGLFSRLWSHQAGGFLLE